MGELHGKLLKEMRDDAQIVVCRFPFPAPTKAALEIGSGIDRVWVYTKPRPSPL